MKTLSDLVSDSKDCCSGEPEEAISISVVKLFTIFSPRERKLFHSQHAHTHSHHNIHESLSELKFDTTENCDNRYYRHNNAPLLITIPIIYNAIISITPWLLIV